MDFSSLRIGREWRNGICENLPPSVALAEVDAHNVVPIWCASDKMEYGARTIRTKITRQLPDFLNEYPVLENPGKAWEFDAPDAIDWDALIADVVKYVDIHRCLLDSFLQSAFFFFGFITCESVYKGISYGYKNDHFDHSIDMVFL